MASGTKYSRRIFRLFLTLGLAGYVSSNLQANDGKSPGVIYELSHLIKQKSKSKNCDSCDGNPCDAASGGWVNGPQPIDQVPVFSTQPKQIPVTPLPVPRPRVNELPKIPQPGNEPKLPSALPLPSVHPLDQHIDPFRDDTPIMRSSRRKPPPPYPTHEAALPAGAIQQNIRRAGPIEHPDASRIHQTQGFEPVHIGSRSNRTKE